MVGAINRKTEVGGRSRLQWKHRSKERAPRALGTEQSPDLKRTNKRGNIKRKMEVKFYKYRAGEIDQQLGTLGILPDDPVWFQYPCQTGLNFLHLQLWSLWAARQR